ncbi:energy transducer TonB [Sphingomonas adhaesiva]|uniref:energy transducer TonB n=1 Tax=Sphingomonas adhaesiva TaxID=28212 RepID=UPI002FF8355C
MLMMGMLLAAAAAPLRLEPSGKWIVDYGSNGCLLARAYGKGADDVTLAWRVLPASDRADLLVNRRMSKDVRRRSTVTISLPPNPPQTVSFDAFSYGDEDKRRYRISVDTAIFAAVVPDAVLTIEPLHEPALQFPVGGLAKAWSAVMECNTTLLKRWGLDPAELARVVTPARAVGSLADWITFDDYPAEARKRGEFGETAILWTIGIDGQIETCRTVNSSGSDALDNAACDAIRRRGRYTAARDAAGKPIRSVQTRRVDWSLPGAWIEDKEYRAYRARMAREWQEKQRAQRDAVQP